MKVAFVMPTYFDSGSVLAGGERYAHGLASAVAKKTKAVLFTFGQESKTLSAGPLEIRCFKTDFYGGGIANPISFRHLHELRNFDVIHCLQFKTLVTETALWAARLAKKKTYVTDLAGGTHYCFSKFFPTEKCVREFLYISEFNRNLNAVIRRPSRIIYGGVDTDYFIPAAAGPAKGPLLYVGRIFRLKGIHLLIQALAADDRLDIVGQCHDQDYLRELKTLASGKNVTFYDSLPDDQVLEKYQTASALVLPCLADGGFTSAMEAMACGLPVIGTQMGSLPEVIREGETGFLVPPGDITALRHAILRLRQNPSLSDSMRRNSRELVLSRFTWEKTAGRCLAAYAS